MKYIMPDEIKSETQVAKGMYVTDLFFVGGYMAVSYIASSIVSSKLHIPYYIFSIACALFLTWKSSSNRHRRNWESIVIYFRNDREVYYPEINISNKRESNNEDTEEKRLY